jgi:peptidoglycan biosynthesis protein MviN/MurJ (putative lipid II flippase)
MIVTLLSVFVTILCSYLFSRYFNISGLSIGRSSGYIIQTILLILFIVFINKRENHFKVIDWELIRDIIKIIVIFFILLILGLFIQANISFFKDVKIDSIVKLILLGGFVIIIYAILTYILKIPEIRSIINFRKKEKII